MGQWKSIAVKACPADDARILLLDVRTPLEFSEINVRGSISLPLHELTPGKVRKLLLGKTACYIFCKSGSRAQLAAEKLSVAGIDNLYVVEGGVDAWAAAGLPVNKGRNVVSLERQVRITAGFFVLTGVLLGFYVNPAWLALSGFVGVGLMLSGITNTCGMALILARMPWNNRVRITA
jgi:rhodanese-related sulfurtransferase